MAGPHANAAVRGAGVKLEEASAAMILLHGRGSTAEDILSLSAFFLQQGLAFVAPQAEGYAWYPYRFLEPIGRNEPYLSSALELVGELVKDLETHDIPPERIFLGGFSQGACLASEFVLRNPRRYAGLLVFSGGYIGPLDMRRTPAGDLGGMPALIGCSDVDPHIPLERVKETAALLGEMGAEVTERIYPGMGHTINDEEIELAGNLVKQSMQASS